MEYYHLKRLTENLNGVYNCNRITSIKKFGYTVNSNKKRIFKIHKKVKIIKNKDTDSVDKGNNYVSDGIKKFTNIYKKILI